GCLSLVLMGASTSQSLIRKLDEMYTQILMRSVFGDCEEQKRSELEQQFRDIVGLLIILRDPLSITALSRLCTVEVTLVCARLGSLRSILDLSDDPDSPIHLVHLLFRDFLIDRQRC